MLTGQQCLVWETLLSYFFGQKLSIWGSLDVTYIILIKNSYLFL